MATGILFVVEEDSEGGFVARAPGKGILTQADDSTARREAVRDAVRGHFPRVRSRPRVIRLRVVRDGVISA